MPDPQPPDELAPKRARKKGRSTNGKLAPVTGAIEIRLSRKMEQALQLRMAGATLQQIADSEDPETGEPMYASPAGASEAIKRALKVILPDATRAEARALELARLDRLSTAHWAQALGSAEGWEAHARIVIQCVHTRNKLLGLDAPTQVDVQVRQGELVRVELLQMLDQETMEALRPIRDEMVRLSELRAGAIDVEATEQ